jgi:hypothetical protein
MRITWWMKRHWVTYLRTAVLVSPTSSRLPMSTAPHSRLGRSRDFGAGGNGSHAAAPSTQGALTALVIDAATIFERPPAE